MIGFLRFSISCNFFSKANLFHLVRLQLNEIKLYIYKFQTQKYMEIFLQFVTFPQKALC